MWSRAELKGRAKAAFKKNYWKSVLVSLVLMILFSGSGSSSTGGRNLVDDTTSNIIEGDSFFDDDYDDSLYYDDGTLVENEDDSLGVTDILSLGFLGALGFGLIVLFAAVAAGVKIFICNPIEVGGCRFFIDNAYENPGAGTLFYAFQSGYYGKMVLTLFLRNLFIVLWSFLLIIPGIVKAYEYRMVPYLLADNPEMSRQDAFQISKEMMNGDKMNAFILDLSFIGWDILSALTFGLVGVFYVNPYENATNAELYLELKRNYSR